MNKVIEIALTVLAVMFLLMVTILVLAGAVCVFLEIVRGFQEGLNIIRSKLRKMSKEG